jgi:hypothetical protein
MHQAQLALAIGLEENVESLRKEDSTISGQYSRHGLLEKVFIGQPSTHADLLRSNSMPSTSSNLAGSALHSLGVQSSRPSESSPSIAEDTELSLSASSGAVLVSSGYRSLRMPATFRRRQILHPSRRFQSKSRGILIYPHWLLQP